MLIFLNIAQYRFDEPYNNGIGQMSQIQAYDDLRILASRNIQQDYKNDMYLESLFANLTYAYGLTPADSVTSVPRLLSSRKNG